MGSERRDFKDDSKVLTGATEEMELPLTEVENEFYYIVSNCFSCQKSGNQEWLEPSRAFVGILPITPSIVVLGIPKSPSGERRRLAFLPLVWG